MGISLGGGGGTEGCINLNAITLGNAASAEEALLPSGKTSWCYCQLTEPEGQAVSASLAASDGSVVTLDSTVSVEPSGELCAVFEHHFETYPPPGIYTFTTELSGQTVVDAFVPAVGVLEFEGWQPDEPVRVIVYAYLADQGDASFVDDIRTQADAEGKLRVATQNAEDDRVQDVMVFVAGQTSGCRMMSTAHDMTEPRGCDGAGTDLNNPILTWTYDAAGPIYQYYEACPGAPRSQVRPGGKVMVTYRLSPLPVRAEPGVSAEAVDQIPAGETADVVEGPMCVDNFVWWKLHSESLYVTGWAPEREDESSAYLLPAASAPVP